MKNIVLFLFLFQSLICVAQNKEVTYSPESDITMVNQKKPKQKFSIDGKWEKIKFINFVKVNPHSIGLKNKNSEIEVAIYDHTSYSDFEKISAEDYRKTSIQNSISSWKSENYSISEVFNIDEQTSIISISKEKSIKTILFASKGKLNYYITLFDNTLSNSEKENNIKKIYNSIKL